MDRVPDFLNLAAHLIYLLSINTILYLFFLYLRTLLENIIRISGVLRVIQVAPCTVTSVLVLVLPISYVEGTYKNYSSRSVLRSVTERFWRKTDWRKPTG